MADTPRIVCAALRYPDFTLVVGPRHFDHIMQMQLDGKEGRPEQGFIDQNGVFYNRVQAWPVAQENGQIIRRVGGDGFLGHGLFSENLY